MVGPLAAVSAIGWPSESRLLRAEVFKETCMRLTRFSASPARYSVRRRSLAQRHRPQLGGRLEFALYQVPRIVQNRVKLELIPKKVPPLLFQGSSPSSASHTCRRRQRAVCVRLWAWAWSRICRRTPQEASWEPWGSASEPALACHIFRRTPVLEIHGSSHVGETQHFWYSSARGAQQKTKCGGCNTWQDTA